MTLRMSPGQRRVALEAFTNAGLIMRESLVDAATGQMAIRSTQDVEPFLDYTRRRRNEDDGCWSPSRDMREVAVVPNIVVEQWIHRYGINAYKPEDQPKVLAMLDDPDWAFLRTGSGRLSRRPFRCYLKGSTSSSTPRQSSVKRITLAR